MTNPASQNPIGTTRHTARPRELCLIEETTIAGTRHVPAIGETVSAYEPGMVLTLERDYNNMFDEWAVRVLDGNRNRLGFVSCECNEIVARLIDGGRRVCGKLEQIETIGNWTRIAMGVYLND